MHAYPQHAHHFSNTWHHDRHVYIDSEARPPWTPEHGQCLGSMQSDHRRGVGYEVRSCDISGLSQQPCGNRHFDRSVDIDGYAAQPQWFSELEQFRDKLQREQHGRMDYECLSHEYPRQALQQPCGNMQFDRPVCMGYEAQPHWTSEPQQIRDTMHGVQFGGMDYAHPAHEIPRQILPRGARQFDRHVYSGAQPHWIQAQCQQLRGTSHLDRRADMDHASRVNPGAHEQVQSSMQSDQYSIKGLDGQPHLIHGIDGSTRWSRSGGLQNYGALRSSQEHVQIHASQGGSIGLPADVGGSILLVQGGHDCVQATGGFTGVIEGPQPQTLKFASTPLCLCGQESRRLTVKKKGANAGREFFGCPEREGKRCGYFQWTDEPLKPVCPCGQQSSSCLVRKEGKNLGRAFFRCSKMQGPCNFFQWADAALSAQASGQRGMVCSISGLVPRGSGEVPAEARDGSSMSAASRPGRCEAKQLPGKCSAGSGGAVQQARVVAAASLWQSGLPPTMPRRCYRVLYTTEALRRRCTFHDGALMVASDGAACLLSRTGEKMKSLRLSQDRCASLEAGAEITDIGMLLVVDSVVSETALHSGAAFASPSTIRPPALRAQRDVAAGPAGPAAQVAPAAPAAPAAQESFAAQASGAPATKAPAGCGKRSEKARARSARSTGTRTKGLVWKRAKTESILGIPNIGRVDGSADAGGEGYYQRAGPLALPIADLVVLDESAQRPTDPTFRPSFPRAPDSPAACSGRLEARSRGCLEEPLEMPPAKKRRGRPPKPSSASGGVSKPASKHARAQPLVGVPVDASDASAPLQEPVLQAAFCHPWESASQSMDLATAGSFLWLKYVS